MAQGAIARATAHARGIQLQCWNLCLIQVCHKRYYHPRAKSNIIAGQFQLQLFAGPFRSPTSLLDQKRF